MGLLTTDVETIEVEDSTVRGGAGGAGGSGGDPGLDGGHGEDGASTFGGAGGLADGEGSDGGPASSAAPGAGAAGGASVGWVRTGPGSLIGEESSFEAGIPGPGGIGQPSGADGAAVAIVR
jgi:hypothetical protein